MFSKVDCVVLVLVVCVSYSLSEDIPYIPSLPGIPKPQWPSYPHLPSIPQWPFPKATGSSSKSMQSFSSPYASYSVFSHNYPGRSQVDYNSNNQYGTPYAYGGRSFGTNNNALGGTPSLYGNAYGTNNYNYGQGGGLINSNVPEVGMSYGSGIDRSYSSPNIPLRYGAGRSLDSSGVGYQQNNFPDDVNRLGSSYGQNYPGSLGSYPGGSQYDGIGIEQGFGQNRNGVPESNIQRIPPSYRRINGRISFNDPITGK